MEFQLETDHHFATWRLVWVIALLRYNSHTIQFIYLKGTVQRFQNIQSCPIITIEPGSPPLQADALLSEPTGKPIITTVSFNFITQKEMSQPLSTTLTIISQHPLNPTPSPSQAFIYFVSINLPILCISYKSNIIAAGSL